MDCKLLLVGLVFLPATPAWAGGSSARAQFVYPYQAVHAPQFFYFVGQPVRIAALVEAELRRDPDYLLFRQFQERRSEFEEFLKGKDGAKPPSEAAAPQGNIGLAATVVRRCASCHSGAAPEGGLFLDGSRQLSASQVTAAQRRVLSGEMPPSEPLSPEEIGNVLQDLLTLERSQP
jgi:hypothetical protein